MTLPRLERQEIDIGDGLHLAVHLGGTGRPLVLIHGAGAGASGVAHYHANIPAFLDAGFRVIVPDLLGFGASSKPVDEQGYPLTRFTDTLAVALDRLDVTRAALLGNSLGGAIALDMVLRMRERVEAAVLLAPGALEERATYAALPKVAEMSSVLARGVTEASMRAMLEMLVGDGTLITDELVAIRTAVARTQPPEVATRLMLPNLSPLLPQVKVPLLVIWGEADGICPVQGAARFSRDCRPAADVMILPDVGHWPMAERAAEVNAASLEFLSNRR